MTTSTPSPAPASANALPPISTPMHRDVIPSEVGWQFVPQYYTFVNKQPNRLHCFYTKNSTFMHGVEGDDGKPCFGQQEIHAKIVSLGFTDCKVFIHSVDAQASAAGGIILQVIGEMSNKGEAWRKFVQSFFLAEQPNGYFVLNDIFRFLKEETVESDAGSEMGGDVHEDEAPIPVEQSQPVEPEPAQTVTPPVEEVQAPEPEPVKQNGFHPPPTESEKSEPEPIVQAFEEPVETVAAPPDVKEPTPVPTPARVSSPAIPAPVVQIPTTPAKTPSPAPPSAVTPAPITPTQPPLATNNAAPIPFPPPASATAPAPAPGPRSWATLAASNSKKWGAGIASESRGVSEIVAPPSNPTPPANNSSAPGSGSQTPVNTGPGGGHRNYGGHGHYRNDRDREHRGDQSPLYIAAQNLTTAQCFVKGVTEPISNSLLTSVLAQRFGPIKDLDVVRSKACAFFEFQTLDAAKRAITASLPVSQGGEGGIRVDVGGEAGYVRITVETRKEKADRPPSKPRGGGPGAGGHGHSASGGGEGRGGYGGDREGGRGNGYRGRGRGRGGQPPPGQTGGGAPGK